MRQRFLSVVSIECLYPTTDVNSFFFLLLSDCEYSEWYSSATDYRISTQSPDGMLKLDTIPHYVKQQRFVNPSFLSARIHIGPVSLSGDDTSSSSFGTLEPEITEPSESSTQIIYYDLIKLLTQLTELTDAEPLWVCYTSHKQVKSIVHIHKLIQTTIN